MATSNRIFSLFSLIGFLLCCISIRRYMQAWNIGTSFIMAWSGLACLNLFINSVIWNDNVNNPAPVWCDISSRLHLLFVIAIPMATVCTCRRVYLLIKGKMPSTTAEKRRTVLFDLFLCLGIPVINVILMYIPQDCRFLIFEDLGCTASTSLTTLGILFGGVPQVFATCICTVYSTLTLFFVYKQHSQLSQLLDNRTNLDRDRYFRLVVISTASTVCLLPLGLYSLITRSLKVYPWPGLTDVHAFISEVYVVPATTWRATQNSQYTVEIFRWEFVFGAFVIFACFGVHREARMDYTSAVRSILRLKRPSSTHDTESASTAIPPLVFAQRPTRRKLRFLDFSPNKTRVIVDVSGALPVTQNSFTSTSASSNF